MAETDLYPPVKRFLEGQGYEVKAEIRDCDVMARRGDEPPLIVELKQVFSLKIVLQGIDRQTLTDAVYIAIGPPKRRDYWDIVKLCRRLGLGLLIVSGDSVEPLADPAPYKPRRNSQRIGMLLKEFSRRIGDPNVGGSGRGKRMTAYRQDALRCAALLGAQGPTKASKVKDATGIARAAGIFQDDVYGWFVRVERGVYGLSPKGEKAIETFASAIADLEAARSAAKNQTCAANQA